MKKSLHLISFDIPYPPNYGGIIDVFFKIKALHECGVSIYLHVHFSGDKKEQIELEKYCEKIFYYRRENRFLSLLSNLPFRIKSRSSKLLIRNLKSLNIPIIFEGLHTIHPLTVFNFNNVFVRTHNIEHDYFFGLSKSEKNIFKKLFFYIEAIKLKKIEKILKNVTGIFTISPFEQSYFEEIYQKKATYIPVFHQNESIKSSIERGDFILYHGDLRVSDNIRAALFLINVYKNSKFKLVIASSCKNKKVLEQIKKYECIYFKDIPTQKSLNQLFQKAHINTLITFQKTGIKLKLLNTLFQGKHIISNSKMLQDTGLENLCELANTREEILEKTSKLFNTLFSIEDQQKRQEQLLHFSPKKNAEKIIKIIFKH